MYTIDWVLVGKEFRRCDRIDRMIAQRAIEDIEKHPEHCYLLLGDTFKDISTTQKEDKPERRQIR